MNNEQLMKPDRAQAAQSGFFVILRVIFEIDTAVLF
jgi:hypothetical protein